MKTAILVLAIAFILGCEEKSGGKTAANPEQTPKEEAIAAKTEAQAEEEAKAAAEAYVKANGGTFTDARNGKTYKTIKIGTQTWMAENLNYNLPGKSWCLPVLPTCDDNGCSEYNPNDTTYCSKYGRLYLWETAKKICPAGFHLPSSDEWDILARAVGSERKQDENSIFVIWPGAGKKLKAADGWISDGHGVNGTDDYGFSALPGGQRFFNGTWGDNHIRGYWWTATEKGKKHAYCRSMWLGDDNLREDNSGKQFAAFSVRCVKDNNQMEVSQ